MRVQANTREIEIVDIGKQMKILLIDDHVSFCEGLIAAVSAQRPDIEFSFESNSELVPTALVGSTQFDLLMVDIMMPGLGGIELIKHLNAMKNFTPTLVISSVEDPEVVQEALDLGVLGYIPKYYSVDQVVDALEQCNAGNIHVPQKLQASLRDLAAQRSIIGKEKNEKGISLSKRQIEILSLMDQGLSNQQIADQLFISLATVKTHAHHLFKLFDVGNRISCLKAAKNAQLI